MIPLITLSRVVSPTRDATNRFTPSGGVMKPIARLTTMMIPKCVTSTPIAVTTGYRMGARIIIAHSVSMKQPTISSSTLISKWAFYECSPDLWFDVPENSKASKFAERYEDDRLWSDDDYNPH